MFISGLQHLIHYSLEAPLKLTTAFPEVVLQTSVASLLCVVPGKLAMQLVLDTVVDVRTVVEKQLHTVKAAFLCSH